MHDYAGLATSRNTYKKQHSASDSITTVVALYKFTYLLTYLLTYLQKLTRVSVTVTSWRLYNDTTSSLEHKDVFNRHQSIQS